MYLGGGYQGGLHLSCVNVDDTTINRFTVVSFKTDADRTYAISSSSFQDSIDRGQGYGIQPTILVPVVPWVTSTDDNPLGIANKQLKSAEHGIITVAGVTMVRTGSSVAAADPLKPSTDGIMITATSTNTAYGVALCTDFVPSDVLDYGTSTTEYCWALVQFLKYPYTV
jgi:hypothetical protein